MKQSRLILCCVRGTPLLHLARVRGIGLKPSLLWKNRWLLLAGIRFFLGLRQLEGIDVGRIEREYGVSLEARFARLRSAGLIEREGSLVRLAPGRVSVANEVFVELMK